MHYLRSVCARAYALAFCLLLSIPLCSQDTDLWLDEEPIDDLDTLSLFQLIDSLILLEASRTSQFSLHIGYTSEVSNAGRTLEVKQYGFNPGISYFHKSGIYADVTGYWNSQVDPSYDLTVVSVGYLGALSKVFTYTVSYDHSFFTEPNPELDLPPWIIELLLPPLLTNTISGGLDADFNHIEFSTDYAFLFNEESAHRLQFALTGDFKKSGFWFLDRVSLRPSASILWGNQDIISVSYSPNTLADTRFPFVIEESNAFGVMNYQLSVPLSLSKGKFLLVFDYNYNIPQSLPGERYEYDNNSFFSVDLYYSFAIGSKKSIFE